MQNQVARILAFGGGAFGVGVALTFLTNLNFDAWPFLVFILLLASIPVITAVWRGIKPLQRSLLWLASGLALFFCAYISRFSIGLFVFPAVALIIFGWIAEYSRLCQRFWSS